MRQPDRSFPDLECPTRYSLDEARFPGGHERITNKEDEVHEPQSHFAQ